MKRKFLQRKPVSLLIASMVSFASVAVILSDDLPGLLDASLISTAYAASPHEGGRGSGSGHDSSSHDSGHDSGHESGLKGAGSHQGGASGRDKAAAQPYRGGKATIDDLLVDDGDEESHRPPWAGKKGGDSHSDDEGHADDSHSDSGHEH